nr:cytochrome c oxidase assembly factor 4-like protein; mitochondrial isoform X2 [Biomphalaria glabrata]
MSYSETFKHNLNNNVFISIGRLFLSKSKIPAGRHKSSRIYLGFGSDNCFMATNEQSGDSSANAEEEVDPVEAMINKTGCLQLHYAVQECIGEKKDWRMCQKEVTEFRKCMEKGRKK